MPQCVLSHFGSKDRGRAFASVGLLPAAAVLKSVRAGPQLRKTAVCVPVSQLCPALLPVWRTTLSLTFVCSALSIFAT